MHFETVNTFNILRNKVNNDLMVFYCIADVKFIWVIGNSASYFFQNINHKLRGVEWVHGLFLFPLVLGKMYLPHAKFGLFCVI